ncbi:hypothetical protein [Streptomyces sp. Tue6028]|uniref:hypothetical protein n=1 Tax=Streptomyces sp. Tue6028 TaxID=2036037 RepID=UPI003EB75A89
MNQPLVPLPLATDTYLATLHEAPADNLLVGRRGELFAGQLPGLRHTEGAASLLSTLDKTDLTVPT